MTDIKEAQGLEVVGYSYGNGMLINNTTSPDDPIYTKLVRLSDATAVIDQLREELEVERLRLAACGAAAIGYYEGCKDEYKSASLADVLQLRERVAELEESNRSWVLRIQQRGIEMDEMSQLIEDQAAELAELKSAPVVVPERDTSYTHHSASTIRKEGWNACLDEVARLNRSKT